MTIMNIVLTPSTESHKSDPLYRQIADAIEQQITSGELSAGHKLPTHRALAEQLKVTVGTVTRAYAEAERRELVEARVGAGTFVCQKDSPSWVYNYSAQEEEACNLGHNIPPCIDRAEMLKEAMDNLSRHPDQLNQMMLYHDPQGLEPHRRVIAHWLQTKGLDIDPERMHFSSGGQHAVQLILSAFCRQGDTLLVEQVTYPGFLSLARQQQVSVKPVELDHEGIIPASLEAACRQYQPRMLYCTPTLQNPTTATMGEQRRNEILAICRRYQVLLVEDDVNGLLPQQRPAPMLNLDPELVIHIGGLSKCLAPGLRLGYIQVPQNLQQRLNTALHNHSLMISPLLTGLACELIQKGDADRVLQQIHHDISLRQQLVSKHLGKFAIQHTPDSFHVWLTLPEYWRLSDFVSAAEQQGVIIKSAEMFTPPGATIPPAVRLAISAPFTHKKLEQGLLILAELLQKDPMNDFAL
ncbi:PLP-dependent aminotransferase family protein [Photobacterium chitinilyticum]|uniref:PLP-dependent aminotransferase family protein n=1 Tax=Photobacterium chitinilyticum TaxID=2485123 RepID=A0A444JMW7_9GAMM|nr:PLP-dependent aminotransferase family protein [Photobacterium chitinilyticum]RWX54446.1 PLP-dependent aminotransferase family protein [Photobacterium chitinilyticum]